MVRSGSRRGAVKSSCLLLAAAALLVLVSGWKALDFLVLRPASVRGELNDVCDTVRGYRGREDERRITFLENWRTHCDSTGNEYVLRCHPPRGAAPTFSNDTLFVQYPDTLHIPVFGRIVKVFRISRPF
jgi:hypothetical protein